MTTDPVKAERDRCLKIIDDAAFLYQEEMGEGREIKIEFLERSAIRLAMLLVKKRIEKP